MNFFKILKGDKMIWILLMLLAAISILSVYSSTYRITMRESNLVGAISRHVLFLIVGFGLMLFMQNVSMRFYKRWVPIFLFPVIICLIILFFSQSEGGVARRWMFSRSFQPSDIAKVLMVAYLAKVISKGFGGNVKQFFWWVIFPVFLVCGLVLRAHTSNAMIIGSASMLIVFMGASNRKYQSISILCACVVMVFYLLFYKDIGRGETVSNRVKTWSATTFPFRPAKKTLDTTAESKRTHQGYKQAETVKYAIVAGGIFRVAPGKSVYRKTLSEAHNDFIFAMIVEEYGLFGGILVITVYLLLFYRILQVIRKCTKPFPALLVSGLLIVIISQTFIHIGVSVGGLPITGQNLPMISTGGTSIIITSAAFGMILAVSRIAKREENERKLSQQTNPQQTNPQQTA
jgi:cell division protein FtsW